MAQLLVRFASWSKLQQMHAMIVKKTFTIRLYLGHVEMSPVL